MAILIEDKDGNRQKVAGFGGVKFLGRGIPAGGTTGQALVKRTDANYDTEWQDQNGGVTSFNHRTGAVVPQKGDYTAEQVGARPSDWTPTAADVGARPSDWTPTAEEVGARPSDWTPTAAEVGALPIEGGTLTGALTLSGEPASDLQAATKKYVDDAIKTAVSDSWEASY